LSILDFHHPGLQFAFFFRLAQKLPVFGTKLQTRKKVRATQLRS
jgi:hypothetical protein